MDLKLPTNVTCNWWATWQLPKQAVHSAEHLYLWTIFRFCFIFLYASLDYNLKQWIQNKIVKKRNII